MLVVATPCPLLLAAPVAIVAGLSRCARRGVVVKGGGALEALAVADVLLFDKTGTLTASRPTIVEIVTTDDLDATEVLGFAASLDQISPHVLATAIVRRAHERGLALVVPTDASEQPGAPLTRRQCARTRRLAHARHHDERPRRRHLLDRDLDHHGTVVRHRGAQRIGELVRSVGA